MAQHFVAEKRRHRVSMSAVGKAFLLGEDVPVEPFEQPVAMRGNAVGLRVMDMRVDKAGDDQLARPVRHRRVGEAGCECGMVAERDDDAIVDHQQSIGMVMDGVVTSDLRVVGDAQQFGAVGGEGHAAGSTRAAS